MLSNFMKNGKSPTSVSNKLPLISCGNSGKQLVSGMIFSFLYGRSSTFYSFQLAKSCCIRADPASTSMLVQVNNNENLVYMICYRSWLHQGWEELRNSHQSYSAKLKLQNKIFLVFVFLEIDPGGRGKRA
ncbi:hypothetical protein MKW98_006821 [Papaver atlanticum]|uniref:Uncharacterized protein n=1 Tax=Papaver atlanticum TaxID=357466 RepID=A0AAD4SSX8_9MAGN|nr:hypothetical protein MKW98_006821 [Papaver atlanticum]